MLHQHCTCFQHLMGKHGLETFKLIGQAVLMMHKQQDTALKENKIHGCEQL